MILFGLIIVISLLIIGLKISKNEKIKKDREIFTRNEAKTDRARTDYLTIEPRIEGKSEYTSKKPLSEIEQIAYWIIKEAVGEEKIVLSQVAWSSFIRTKGDKNEKTVAWMKARQKVADFVICSRDFSIKCIIEVDDSSHNTDKDEARDAMTREAGIKTIRIKARNLPSANELKEMI